MFLGGTVLTVNRRDQLKENALLKKFYCDVNIGDLIKFNEELAHRLMTEPADIIPLVCRVLYLSKSVYF
jgi:hypothetical protein